MSIDLRASGSDLDLWSVQLPGGIVRTMTLDELDNAFQAGTIGERTMVLKAGAIHWTTLGDAAGLQDEAEEEQPNSLAPFATDVAASYSPPIPRSPLPSIDLSLSTSELAAFRPKRRTGRVLF